MTAKTTTSIDSVLRYEVLGSRRFSNYWWATVVSIGGTGFLLSGLSSYWHVNLLPFADPTQLVFIPQGIAMGFYGVCALLLGLYLWLTVLLDVGGGYNEFDRKTGNIRIFRWGFPGKNRKLDFTCKTSDVQSVRVDIKEGLSPRRSIYLKLKDRRQFPLTRVGQPIALSQVENQAAELARFLQVPLEGL
ncbi:photosystem I assembly protein Ycf4 [Microcoleus sp. ARI1-B5]|uniref:photosystem I assembly protein Ycf4 n=1 Tax=unclassified Microcoleus TaxID=2642155 RepID=UPI002FD526A6